jgi:hypothetical protein
MNNITIKTHKAFTRYFNTLSKLGYMNYSDVNKLLVLSFTEELLTGDLSSFVNEEDYRSITNVIYCISNNTCLLDLPSCNDKL